MEFTAQNAQQRSEFLRDYVGNQIIQLVRLEKTIKDYEELAKELTERIIDQNVLIQHAQSTGSKSHENILKNRQKKDEAHKERIENKILPELSQKRDNILEDLQAHAYQYSEAEIELGGFVTHQFGIQDNVKYDKSTETLTFNKGGYAQTVIAVPLDHWRDSSQIIIRRM